jgi:DNA (cytosine-5)-methyltransferase 1
MPAADKGSSFTFVDMCCGIGAFHIALQALGGSCLLACDRDEHVRETYQSNFGTGFKWHSDLFTLTKLPEHDVFCSGFPCTTFSLAGHRKGAEEDGGEGQVIFHLMKLLRDMKRRPRVIMLENVVGLASIHNGKLMKFIIDDLESMGYAVKVSQFDAADFGAPMHRSRLLIMGTRGFDLLNSQPVSKRQPSVVADFVKKKNNTDAKLILHEERYVMLPEDSIKTKNNKIFVGYLPQVNYRYDDMSLFANHGQALKIYDCEGLSENFTATHRHAFLVKDADDKRKDVVRYLSEQEMYRCMGFPKAFKMHGTSTVRLRQLGKSVNLFMLRPICKWIIREWRRARA